MAHHFPVSNNPNAWFEALYARANRDARAVPWANLTAHPDLVEWVHQRDLRGDGQKALVVGCGLGDDAEALSASGFAVSAFDVSPTAIDWCQRRFPNSGVDYQVADLFQTPPAWREHFDFALEIRTIQSLPPTLHEKAMQHISQHVAPGGTLLVICQGREAGFDVSGPPWPLVRTELDAFPRFGLEEAAFKETLLRSNPSLWTYRVEYRRPLSR
jgi:SAM-dependent methyltransferase